MHRIWKSEQESGLWVIQWIFRLAEVKAKVILKAEDANAGSQNLYHGNSQMFCK